MSTTRFSSLPLIIVSAIVSAAPAFAHDVSPAKAAELSLHRLERLVLLKKLDASFQTNLKGLTMSLLAHQQEEDPSFKALISQVPGTDGTRNIVEIVLDEEGRPVSFTPTPGSASVNAPQWPGIDAATLLENSLHYLEDKATSDTTLAPFNEGLTEMSLSQTTDASGAVTATVEILSANSTSKLEIALKADGTVSSATVVAPTQQ